MLIEFKVCIGLFDEYIVVQCWFVQWRFWCNKSGKVLIIFVVVCFIISFSCVIVGDIIVYCVVDSGCFIIFVDMVVSYIWCC